MPSCVTEPERKSLQDRGFEEAQWHLVHARYQGWNIARFLSPDLAVLRESTPDPQRWNRYTYGGNNPLRYIDPDGASLADVGAGASNALASDLTVGAVRRAQPINRDEALGQRIGDATAMLMGVLEMAGGATLFIGGSMITATSAGTAGPASAPAALGGAAVALHGAAVAGTVLMSTSNSGSGAGSSGRTGKHAQDKKLSKGDIKKLKSRGFDPEQMKGGKGTGKLDLYKDRNGNVVVKPKGGSGPGEPTGVNLKKLD